MSDFRKNYIKAREIIAQELKEKYNLIESYRESDRLTLDSETHSIHLTFFTPDGDDVFIYEKNKDYGYGESFFHFVNSTHSISDNFEDIMKDIFTPMQKKSEPYSIENLYITFSDKIRFLEKNYPHFFTGKII